MSEDDVSARDALAIAQRALAKANEISDLEAEVDELRSRVTAAELRLSEFDDDRDYADLTRDDKVGIVREHAFAKAEQGTGTASLDYDDIMWEVFDGEPSADHCYTLMELAADVRGFGVRNPAQGNRTLTVNADDAKLGAVFSSANKTASGEVR